MNNDRPSQADLRAMARQIMLEHGFEPDFPSSVAQQLAQIRNVPSDGASPDVRDLRNLLWSSIDNDTSRDLDQIEVAEKLPDGNTRVMVGIADVDTFVTKASPIDDHAAKETTTVYTGVCNFPMIPEELSTGASSLLENEDRPAIVIEFTVASDGTVNSGNAYRATVRNKAQLTYNAVGAWLEGTGAAPPKVEASAGLQAQLKLQDQVAQALKNQRHQHGALNIETTEVHAVMLNQQVADLVKQERNRATDLIEDFMIAANGVVARILENVPSLRRIVKTPERWDRIVQLAASQGEQLPAQPDSKALNDFLLKRKAADPDHFPDLSLAMIKLIGPGEYVLERPGDPTPGHFGLAVQDYTHSTAPNRRFADVVTQRLLKALLAASHNPYSDDELVDIARNCTVKEDAARKVEREMSKRLAAVAMRHRIGETFDAIVTGVTPAWYFRPRAAAPHRRTAGAEPSHVGCRRQIAGQAHAHGRAAGIYRLRARVSREPQVSAKERCEQSHFLLDHLSSGGRGSFCSISWIFCGACRLNILFISGVNSRRILEEASELSAPRKRFMVSSKPRSRLV